MRTKSSGWRLAQGEKAHVTGVVLAASLLLAGCSAERPDAPERPSTTTLLVTGDLMLVRRVPDAGAALAPMRDLLRGADLTVGNLESTLSTNGSPTQGGDSFGGSQALVPVLEDAGFDAVSLANNHNGDYGVPALLETVKTLRGGPVKAFGTGRNARVAARPAIVEAPDGTSFAFLGFNAIGETPRARGTGPVRCRSGCRLAPARSTRADLTRATAAVRRASSQADVVVVVPHWGEQYTHRRYRVERRVARALVKAGADLVVGSHPHWVQGIDCVAGVPVLYSLGNFVFDMDHQPQVMEGVVLEATFDADRLLSDAVASLPNGPADVRPTADPGRRRPRRCPVAQHRVVQAGLDSALRSRSALTRQ